MERKLQKHIFVASKVKAFTKIMLGVGIGTKGIRKMRK